MKNKKIISLGLALSLAISPLNYNKVFAAKPTSIHVNSDANVENSEEYKLLKANFEKYISKQAKLEENLKKENKKSPSLTSKIIKCGLVTTLFSIIVAAYYKYQYCYKYEIGDGFLRKIVEKTSDSLGVPTPGVCPKILRPFRNYGNLFVDLIIEIMSPFTEDNVAD